MKKIISNGTLWNWTGVSGLERESPSATLEIWPKILHWPTPPPAKKDDYSSFDGLVETQTKSKTQW